jgi:hypothetical protein
MKSRLLLLVALAVCGSAQIRPTAVRSTVQGLDGPLSSSTAVPKPDDFPGFTFSPPVSATVKNGILSLVINSSPASIAGPRSKVTEVSGDTRAKSTENSVRMGEPAQLSATAGNIAVSNAIEPRVVTLPIRISDVTGLSAALSDINNSLASLTTTTTNLNTNLTSLTATVTTLSARVANLVPVPIFVDFEIPTGTIDGSNPVFVLSAAPLPASSLVLIKNGLKLSPGGDYSLSGTTILFAAAAVPQPGDLLIASYRR